MASCPSEDQSNVLVVDVSPPDGVGGVEGGDGESRLIPRVLLTSRRQWRGPGGYKVAGLADRTASSGGSTQPYTSGPEGLQGKHTT